jgi:hypothetical protein
MEQREDVGFTAEFATGERTPWRFDPETGERAPYAHLGPPSSLAIHLAPLESLLLVFEPDAPGPEAPPPFVPPQAMEPKEWRTLTSDWQLLLRPVGGQAPFERRLGQLSDLSLSADPELARFGGTVTYSTAFSAGGTAYDTLDLGPVSGVSEVRLNGRRLGVRWWGRHRYDISGALGSENRLEVDVTTTVANYVKSLSDDATAQRWTSWFPPIPAGLIGPVQLIRSR